MGELSIGDVASRTGVGEGTLRMWEQRHGFPIPERMPSGHRRYSEEQLELVREVVSLRRAGLSLPAAIARVQHSLEQPGVSIFATLRARRQELQPLLLAKPVVLALSHAIEDEVLARAGRAVLFASFQRVRFYRRARPRWRELARAAELTVVFADFRRRRSRPGEPAEVPLEPGSALEREWAIVCDGEGSSACLVGREPPFSSVQQRSSERAFEVVWSVEPAVVRDAARICAALAARSLGPLPQVVAERLRAEPVAAADQQLRLAAAIANRALSYVG